VFLDSNPGVWLDDAVVQKHNPLRTRGHGDTKRRNQEMGLPEGDRLHVSCVGRETFRLADAAHSEGVQLPPVPQGLCGRSFAARVLRRAPRDFTAGRRGTTCAPRAYRATPVRAATPRLRSARTGLVNHVDRQRCPWASGPEASAPWAGVGCPWGARLSKQPAFAALIWGRAAKQTCPVETRRGHK
jgi:hypothetical protein